MVRYSLRALTVADHDPTSVIANLNAVLLKAEASGADGERFCTVLLGMLTLDGPPTITLASGGHPYPMIRRADGDVVEVPVGGTLVGALDEAVVETRQVTVGPGECLVAYTDGVFEARSAGEQFGMERLKAAIAASPDTDAAAIGHTVEDAVLRFGHRVIEDDLAVLVIRIRPSLG
jgi:sigma-B regulation protein RsbU (phosphoserine phosphatase)